MPADVTDWEACVEHGDAARFFWGAIASGALGNGRQRIDSENTYSTVDRTTIKFCLYLLAKLPQATGLLKFVHLVLVH